MAKKQVKQESMFEQLGVEEKWREEWKDMPEFTREDEEPYQKIIVNFKSREEVQKFAELVGQRLTNKTNSIWFPKREYKPVGIYIDEP